MQYLFVLLLAGCVLADERYPEPTPTGTRTAGDTVQVEPPCPYDTCYREVGPPPAPPSLP